MVAELFVNDQVVLQDQKTVTRNKNKATYAGKFNQDKKD
jgi:hypothetical protein